MLRSLQFIGIEINRRRRWEISMINDDTALLARLYPEDTVDLLPTRLGNVLRAAERRAGQHYGFTSPVEILPRIYPYISATLSETMSDARDELDISCRMCAVLWVLAMLSAVVFAADGAVAATGGALLVIPAVAVLIGIMSYRAAVRSAEDYGRFLYYVFDLHRRDLIRALGYVPPRSPEAEFRLIQEITAWLVEGSQGPGNYRDRSN